MPTFPYVGLALTPDAFRDYAARYDFGSIPPDYVVLHHTAIPTASWAPSGDPAKFWDAGEAGLTDAQIATKRLNQLTGLMRYYRDTLGWSAGPHVFVDDRLIYLMTPMRDIGIHAMWGNSFTRNGRLHYSMGIEVIGDYTRVRWPSAVQATVRSAVQTLQQRLGTFALDYMYADPATKPGRAQNANGWYCPYPERLRWGGLSSHRDYNKPTCPGDAITEDFYLSVVRGPAAAPAAPADGLPTPLPYIGVASPSISQETFRAVLRDHKAPIANFEANYIYDRCVALNIDPAIVLAQFWKETTWGQHPRFVATWNPLNRTVRSGYDLVQRDGFACFEGAWMGFDDNLLWLKKEYGWRRGLRTLEEIVPVWAPASDGNNPQEYIASVRRTVAAIRSRER